MKLLQILFCVALFNFARAGWLGDVFTGLDEAAKDLELKDTVKTIKDAGKKVADKLLKILPEADWVKETKNFLHNIKFKDVLEQKSNLTMDQIVERWNGLLKELNNEEKFADPNEMYTKIKKDIKNILPSKIYKKWKKEIHSLSKKLKKIVKDFDIEDLKAHVSNWKQPTFMTEDVEKEKEMIKDAVEAANKKIKERTDDVMPLIKLTTNENENENEETNEEKRVENWLKKRFVKPHHESGQSKWKTLITKLSLNKAETKFQKVPAKKLKKMFMKLMKKNQKKIFAVKKPEKTEVTVLTTKNVPIIMSEDDSKKLELLTPEEKKEYQKAEAKWEKQVLNEAERLVKRMRFGKIDGDEEKLPTAAPTTTATTTAPKKNGAKVVLAGNENWGLSNKDFMELVPWGSEDDDDDDVDDKDDVDDEDDKEDDDANKDKIDMLSTKLQSTRAMLNKDQFTKKLADEEVAWFNIKKDLLSKMNKFGA